VERALHRNRTAALAAAVAHEINEELTLILGSLKSSLPEAEKSRIVEQAAQRCATLSRRLQMYVRRCGPRRHAPLSAVLDELV
jgi:signal transduction histidine kinase